MRGVTCSTLRGRVYSDETSSTELQRLLRPPLSYAADAIYLRSPVRSSSPALWRRYRRLRGGYGRFTPSRRITTRKTYYQFDAVADPRGEEHAAQTREKLCNHYGIVAENSVKYASPDGFFGIHILHNLISAIGAPPPDPAGGAYDAPPDLLVDWAWDAPSPFLSTSSASRLGVFGTEKRTLGVALQTQFLDLLLVRRLTENQVIIIQGVSNERRPRVIGWIRYIACRCATEPIFATCCTGKLIKLAFTRKTSMKMCKWSWVIVYGKSHAISKQNVKNNLQSIPI